MRQTQHTYRDGKGKRADRGENIIFNSAMQLKFVSDALILNVCGKNDLNGMKNESNEFNERRFVRQQYIYFMCLQETSLYF
jgi:hypothetical protein